MHRLVCVAGLDRKVEALVYAQALAGYGTATAINYTRNEYGINQGLAFAKYLILMRHMRPYAAFAGITQGTCTWSWTWPRGFTQAAGDPQAWAALQGWRHDYWV